MRINSPAILHFDWYSLLSDGQDEIYLWLRSPFGEVSDVQVRDICEKCADDTLGKMSGQVA